MVQWYNYLTSFILTFRECFISNDSSYSLAAFCKVASYYIANIRRSKVPDSLWAQYIFDMAETFCQNPTHRTMIMVTCVGKQPDSNIWVFNSETQINAQGELISKQNQEYYW